MMFIIALIIFILILGLVVLIHEGGHFLVALREGMKVKEFAFGFPPRIWSRKIGFTRFCLNLIPLGGYVSIVGEDDNSREEGSFATKSPWSRLRVVIAGILMNIALAWVLLTIWFWITPLFVQPRAIVVTEIIENSAAARAGLKVNDFIISAGGTEFGSDNELIEFTKIHQGEEIELRIVRNGGELTVPVSLDSDGQTALGVRINDLSRQVEKIQWWQAPWYALLEIWGYTVITFSFIGGLILKLFGGASEISTEAVSGPVGIFVFLQQIITLGLPFLLRFTALISLAVGLFNLIPFPALDGGRALFILMEGVFGRKVVQPKTEAFIHAAGFIILITLMIIVTYFDIQRL